MADERPRSSDLTRALDTYRAARAARDAHGLSGVPADVDARYQAARAAVAAAADPLERARLETELRDTFDGPAAPSVAPSVPLADRAKRAAVESGRATGTLVGSQGGAKLGAAAGASVAGPAGVAVGTKLGSAIGRRVGAKVGGGAVGRGFDAIRSTASALRRIPGGWRVAGSVDRAVPSSDQLLAAGRGSLAAGLEWFANRNPLYRLFSRFLPQVPWIRASASVACGCTSGAGCGCKCCSCGCMFAPIGALAAIAVITILAISGTFGFALPGICSRAGVECTDGAVSFVITPDDVPSGSVVYWKDAEARTGVPWFYLAAWEKVASDFGRADLAAEPRNQNAPPVPASVVDILMTQAASGASVYEDGHAPPDAATSAALAAEDAQAINELIRRLISNARGGSFGTYLITRDEWERYGNAGGTAPSPGAGGDITTTPGLIFPPLAAVSSPYACADGRPITPPDPRTNANERALMSTAFLARIGAPDTPDLRRAVEAWAQQETSWRSRPIYSGNPFSVGSAATTAECGEFTTTVGIAVFRDLRTAVEASADVLLEPAYRSYGYGAAVSAARAGDASGFLIWLAASGWSGASHYGCGADGTGANSLLDRYRELGGEVDSLVAECVKQGSGYDPATALRVLNPFARRDGAYIVGQSIDDAYLALVVSGITSLENAAGATADRPSLSEVLAMDSYFVTLAGATPPAEGAGIPGEFASLVGYVDDRGGILGSGFFGSGIIRPRIDGWTGDCIAGVVPCVIRGGSWPSGEEVPSALAGTEVTPLQRAYACTLVTERAAAVLLAADPVGAETFLETACTRFEVSAGSLSIGGKATLGDALSEIYIPAAAAPPPGQAVLDWEKMSTLMSGLLAQGGLWGDPSAVLTIPTSNGERQVNVFASAIDAYARAIYEAHSAAEVRRSTEDTPEARARDAELRFYGPLVDDALEGSGIAVDRTVVLGTLVADEVMGTTGSPAGCRPYANSPSRADGLAPTGDPGVLARYDAILAADAGKLPSILRDNGLRAASIAEKVDPLLLVAIADVESGFDTGYVDGDRTGLFGLTAADGLLYSISDPAVPADAVTGGARKVAALVGVYGLKAGIGAYRAGTEALADAGGKITRLPAAVRTYISAVVARYTALIDANPLTVDLADTPVSGLIGCYRWGSGEATLYMPERSTDPERYAIAMNFCAPGAGDCGSAVVRVGNRAVLVRVTDFYDGGIGDSDARIAGLRPAVRDALGLGGDGPFDVTIELLGRTILESGAYGPLGDRDPATLGVDLTRAGDRVLESGPPPVAVATLLRELRTSLAAQGLTSADVPNLGHYAVFLAARGRCSTTGPVTVADPFRPAGADGLPATAQVASCDYVTTALAAIEDFLGGRAGAVSSAQYGLQAVSQFGYINPIVGARISSGFLPRSFATTLRITANGRTYSVHDGIDFTIGNFADNLVVAVADGLAYWSPGREGYCSGGSCTYRPTMILRVKGSDGAVWTYGHVIAEYFADPAIAAAYDVSPLRVNGHRAVQVHQGDTLAQIAAGPNHLHLEACFPARILNTPYRYPFLGDPNALYVSPGENLCIDPLTLLPQVLDEYAGGRRGSLGEYATTDAYRGAPNAPFPPLADPARLPGYDGRLNGGTGAAIAPGTMKLAAQLLGPAGGTVRWTAFAKATGYDVRLVPADEADCEVAGGISKRATGRATSLVIADTSFDGKPARVWAVCVRARLSDGRTTAWTRGAIAPAVTTPVAAAIVARPASIAWSAVAGASAYRVELSVSADFAAAVAYVTTKRIYTASLAAGSWYVRVTALVDAGTTGRLAAPPGTAVRFTAR